MKHTQGPWTDTRVYKDFENTPYCFRVYGNNGKTTVHSQKVNGMELEALANARLISAAPDLLEALKALLNRINHNTDPLHTLPPALYNKYINQARYAIIKAEGK